MPLKPTIQIIEPDAYLAGIYARKFEMDGWRVLVAETFEEAEKQRKKKNIMALILEPDINLDQAEKVIKSLRQSVATALLPIFILTTISEKAEIARMQKAGASAYLLKGHFVPAEVVRKVKSTLILNKT